MDTISLLLKINYIFALILAGGGSLATLIMYRDRDGRSAARFTLFSLLTGIAGIMLVGTYKLIKRAELPMPQIPARLKKSAYPKAQALLNR